MLWLVEMIEDCEAARSNLAAARLPKTLPAGDSPSCDSADRPVACLDWRELEPGKLIVSMTCRTPREVGAFPALVRELLRKSWRRISEQPMLLWERRDLLCGQDVYRVLLEGSLT